MRWFKQLDRIAVGVLDLNLTPAGTGFHLVSKAEAVALESGDTTWKIGDSQHDAVPAAGFLTLTVRHRPRARRSGATQQDLRISERHTGECRKLLMIQRETEMLCVERHRASHICHLVAEAVDTLDECRCVSV